MIEPVLQIDEFGTKRWYLNGKRHREGGPAIEKTNGTKKWYLNGKLHREDGPAIEWSIKNLHNRYYENRSDSEESESLGPAVIRADGFVVVHADGAKEWWLNGDFIKYGERPENWDELVVLAQIERVMIE